MIVIIFIVRVCSDYNVKDKYRKEILKNSDSISGYVLSSETLRGGMEINLDNGIKTVLIHSRNYDNYYIWLSDFIQQGDYIVKKRFNDSLMIYRNNNYYYFILGDYINESKSFIKVAKRINPKGIK